jgi:hypothetical protein
MLFIDADGNYPRHMGDLLQVDADWTEGQALPAGWVFVNEVAIPTFDFETKKLEELTPTLAEDGLYYQTWNVRDFTADELEIINAPTTARNKLKDLGLTDHEVDAIFLSFR